MKLPTQMLIESFGAPETKKSWGIVAKRSGGSIFGATTSWAKDSDGETAVFDSEEAARTQADKWNASLTSDLNVNYHVAPLEDEK